VELEVNAEHVCVWAPVDLGIGEPLAAEATWSRSHPHAPHNILRGVPGGCEGRLESVVLGCVV
jgi:hypothetical protein